MDKRRRLQDFISREYRSLLSYISSRIPFTSPMDMEPEDILHDVMERILSRIDEMNPVVNLQAYVRSSIKNNIIDRQRKRRLKTSSLDQPAGKEVEESLMNLVEDFRYEGSRKLEEEESLKVLYKALEQLSTAEQTLIVATDIKGIGFKELSREWGIPMGTLTSRKKRALEKMRKYILEQDKDGGSYET